MCNSRHNLSLKFHFTARKNISRSLTIHLFYILFALLIISNGRCNKNDSPYFTSPPWGPVTGDRGNYSFYATAIDPDNDSILIRFDWGDSTISLWSDTIASGDTTSLIHFFGEYTTYEIRAQAMDVNGEQSDWSDQHSFMCFSDLLWKHRYGGNVDDFGYDVKQTSDDGYIIVGGTRSFGTGGLDVYVIKTTSDGTLDWQQTYGGVFDDCAYSVQIASDNNYIICGYTESFGNGAADVYLLKIQTDGAIIWEKTYGSLQAEYGYCLQKTNDNGYIITGFTSSYGAGSGDVYLIKTDANGDTLWTQTYGGVGNDCGYSVKQTTGNGYIITGYTCPSGGGNADIYLIKTDINGNETWATTYGVNQWDRGNDVIQTSDGGYIVAGGNGNALVVKYDGSGNRLWVNSYGEPFCNDYANAIQSTLDNCYVFTGYTSSFSSGSFNDIYLVKIDINGNTIWERPYGAWQNDYGNAIIINNENYLIIAGYYYRELFYEVLLVKAEND